MDDINDSDFARYHEKRSPDISDCEVTISDTNVSLSDGELINFPIVVMYRPLTQTEKEWNKRWHPELAPSHPQSRLRSEIILDPEWIEPSEGWMTAEEAIKWLAENKEV